MNFDDIKRKHNLTLELNSLNVRYIEDDDNDNFIIAPKTINDRAYPDLTLLQSSSNTRYIYDDNNKKLIVGPIYINDYSLINKRTIYSKAGIPISFSEMDHYM